MFVYFIFLFVQYVEAKSILKIQMYSTKNVCRLVVVGDSPINDIQQKNIPQFGASTSKFLLYIKGFSTENPFSSDVNIDGIKHIDIKNQSKDLQITIDLFEIREGIITTLTPELYIIDLTKNMVQTDKSSGYFEGIPSNDLILQEYIDLGIISDKYRRDVPSDGETIVINHNSSKTSDSTRSGDFKINNNLPRIVIDPGHGGNDHPGAIGQFGLRESDITLEISKKLQQKLLKDGYPVILTRETDEFVSLTERVRIANSYRAELFISIHINAAPVNWMRGFEVYTVATDKNSMHQVSSHHKSMIVQPIDNNKDILQSLVNSNPNQNSVDLANLVLNQIITDLEHNYPSKTFVNHGHKTAMFTVLVGTTMPAILMESSFISNPEEERWLRTSYYKESIANSLYKATVEYCKQKTISVSTAKEKEEKE